MPGTVVSNYTHNYPFEVVVENGKLVYGQSGMLVETVEGSKWIFVLSTSRALYVGLCLHSNWPIGKTVRHTFFSLYLNVILLSLHCMAFWRIVLFLVFFFYLVSLLTNILYVNCFKSNFSHQLYKNDMLIRRANNYF